MGVRGRGRRFWRVRGILKKQSPQGGIRIGSKCIFFCLCNVLFFAIFFARYLGHGGEVVNEEKMCEAIRKAEGIHSKYPYGIKSIFCSGDSCKQACLHTIRHSYRDFRIHGGSEIKEFIKCLGKKYVGNTDYIGEKNWIKNVTYWYYKQGGNNG